MSDAVTLQAQITDYQRVGQAIAVENFGLRNELAVCVRTIQELRAAVSRLTEERDALKAECERLMDVHGELIREQAAVPARTGRKT